MTDSIAALAREQLETIVHGVRRALWLSPEGWDPDKTWGAETLDEIAAALDQAGLCPAQKMDLQNLFAYAEAHGNDAGSPAEVGDLQELCGLMWQRLNPEEQQAVVKELTWEEE